MLKVNDGASGIVSLLKWREGHEFKVRNNKN